MGNEDAESYDTLTLPPMNFSMTQEDVLMDLETKRFDKGPNSPQRRVSCISSFGRQAPPVRRESFGGRRLSMDLTRPRLSPQFKRDKTMNKLFFDMDVSTRKAGEDMGILIHDIQTVHTSNSSIGKRIDSLLRAAADMRDSHRNIFTPIESTFIPTTRKEK